MCACVCERETRGSEMCRRQPGHPASTKMCRFRLCVHTEMHLDADTHGAAVTHRTCGGPDVTSTSHGRYAHSATQRLSHLEFALPSGWL